MPNYNPNRSSQLSRSANHLPFVALLHGQCRACPVLRSLAPRRLFYRTFELLLLCMHKARDGPPAKAKHAGCIPMKSQRASKSRVETASFAGEPELSKLGTNTGVYAARGAAACGWAEAKDGTIRLCLALTAAARQQSQRRKPMVVQWPRGKVPGLLTEPACMPAYPPTYRKNPRRNCFYISRGSAAAHCKPIPTARSEGYPAPQVHC